MLARPLHNIILNLHYICISNPLLLTNWAEVDPQLLGSASRICSKAWGYCRTGARESLAPFTLVVKFSLNQICATYRLESDWHKSSHDSFDQIGLQSVCGTDLIQAGFDGHMYSHRLKQETLFKNNLMNSETQTTGYSSIQFHRPTSAIY